jgi:hypothetical protein
MTVRRSLWSGLGVLAALLLLNAVLVIGDFIEARRALVPSQISLELVGLVVVFALVSVSLRGRQLPRPVFWLLGIAVLVVALVRAADILVPWFFGRYFNAAVDLRFLPVFYDMAAAAVPRPQFVVILVGLASGLILAAAILRYAIGAVWHGLARRQLVPFGVAALACAVAWIAIPPPGAGDNFIAPPVAGDAGLLTAKASKVVAYNLRGIIAADTVRREYQAEIDKAVAARPKVTNLRKLAGHNVLLMFVESYGSINFKDPAFAAVQLPTIAAFEKQVRAAGYHAYSDTLTSPITGGGSWMAHATMTTGVKVDNQGLYDVLLTGNIQAMGSVFRADGYRTVAAMPRMNQPWPEGAFFGFDKVYQEQTFDYRGRRFSWESIPDELILEKMHRFELTEPKQPVFVQYVLSSSHAPFDLIPTLVPDPTSLTDGANYFNLPAQPFPVKDGRVFDNVAGYQASIRYTMDSIGRYLAERLKDDSLIIVLGDHQPPLTAVAASRDKTVPIHVLSRDPAMVEPFRAAGWAAGMTPAFRTPGTSMEDFLAAFVGSFSTADASVAPVRR